MRFHVGTDADVCRPGPGGTLKQRVKRIIVAERSKAMSHVTLVSGGLIIGSIGRAHGAAKI
jgi:hypothetical protein